MTETNRFSRLTRPVRTGLKWFDTHILSAETRHEAINVLYALFALGMLMHHAHIVLYYNTYPRIWTYFNQGKIVFAIVSILLGKMWKDKGFWILAVLLLMKLLRLNFGFPYDEIKSTWMTILYRGTFAFFGCYAVGRVLQGKAMKRFLLAACICWIAAMAVLSALSIHVAWTGVPMENLGNKTINLSDHRVNPVFYCVEAGILAAASVAFGFVLVSLTKPKALKAAEILLLAVIFLMGVLTVTRTGYIMIGAEIGLLVCLPLYDRFRKKPREKPAAHLGQRAVLAAVFLVILVSLTMLQTKAVDWFSAVRENGAVSSASAEDSPLPETEEEPAPEPTEEPGPLIQGRAFETGSADSFFSQRLGIWSSVFQAAAEKPSILLYGESASGCMEKVDEVMQERGLTKVYHAHSEYLQILLENGLPGMLLFLAFTLYFLWNAFRVFRAGELPFWQRLIPIVAIGCFVSALVECTCYVNNGHPQASLLYLAAGITTALGQQLKKTQER